MMTRDLGAILDYEYTSPTVQMPELERTWVPYWSSLTSNRLHSLRLNWRNMNLFIAPTVLGFLSQPARCNSN